MWVLWGVRERERRRKVGGKVERMEECRTREGKLYALEKGVERRGRKGNGYE